MTFGSTFGRVLSPTFQPKSQAVASAAAFVPTDISGCALWLDFSDANYLYKDAGSTKVSSDGDVIYQINDKSGNSRNAVRIYASNATAYKTNIQNGLSVGRYGANNDIHQITMTLAQPLTTFIVAYPTAASNACEYLRGGGSTWLIRSATSTGVLHYAGASLSVTANQLNKFTVMTVVTDGANSLIRVNGSSVGTGNPGTGYPTNPQINQAYSWRGDFGETIMYNTALSDTDKGKVETYLNNKWAIY